MTQNPMVHIDDDDQVECEFVVHSGHPDGYFVLRFTPPGLRRYEQTLTLDLSRDRLRRLQAVIGARLAAIDGPAEHDRPDCDCSHCGAVAVVPAEAATGGALDYDDLLISAMATGFEPRMPDEDDATDAEIAAGVRNAPRSGF